MIKVIVFDMDDTLYRELDFVHGAFKHVTNYLCGKYEALEKQAVYKQMLSILCAEGRGAIFDQIIVKYHLKESIPVLVHKYRAAEPPITLYEDAEDVLRWLKANNYKIGLITDGYSQVQHNKIKLLQLDKWMDEMIVTYDWGLDYSKPHERAYLHMLEQFQCLPEEMIYIGDNPHKDFVGAKKLGIHTVRIIREYGDHMQTCLDEGYEACDKIYSLEELKRIIKEIDGR